VNGAGRGVWGGPRGRWGARIRKVVSRGTGRDAETVPLRRPSNVMANGSKADRHGCSVDIGFLLHVGGLHVQGNCLIDVNRALRHGAVVYNCGGGQPPVRFIRAVFACVCAGIDKASLDVAREYGSTTSRKTTHFGASWTQTETRFSFGHDEVPGAQSDHTNKDEMETHAASDRMPIGSRMTKLEARFSLSLLMGEALSLMTMTKIDARFSFLKDETQTTVLGELIAAQPRMMTTMEMNARLSLLKDEAHANVSLRLRKAGGTDSPGHHDDRA
jgi:hypothetical protein